MIRLAHRVKRLEKKLGVGDDMLIIIRRFPNKDGNVMSSIPRSECPDDLKGIALTQAEFHEMLNSINGKTRGIPSDVCPRIRKDTAR